MHFKVHPTKWHPRRMQSQEPCCHPSSSRSIISAIATTYAFLLHLAHAQISVTTPNVSTIRVSCVTIDSAWLIDTTDQASTIATCICVAIARLHYHQHRHHREQQQQQIQYRQESTAWKSTTTITWIRTTPATAITTRVKSITNSIKAAFRGCCAIAAGY